MKTIKIYYNFVIIIILCELTAIEAKNTYFEDVHLTTAKEKQHYELNADELMESILRQAYKGKFQHKFPTQKNAEEVLSKSVPTTEKTKLPYVQTTHVLPLAKLANNMTLDEYYLRKRNLDLETIIESEEKHIPNFKSEEDEISLQTRRFNDIKESQKGQNILREVYFEGDNATFTYIEKTQVLNLMAQFLYETRYHLPYAQKLRKRYKNHLKYQIGYCFALIRNLKQQQMVLYSTLKSYYGRGLYRNILIRSLYTHLKLYEKVVKLDVDIKDLIRLILHLDKKREHLSTTTTRKSTTP